MIETEREILVCVALPGVNAQQIEILFEADSLVISGERLLPSGMRAALIHRLEIPYGRFERRVALPTEAVELKRRDLVDGCLILTLGKA
ncbi:MAG: Hsp20/alpha crystallin family protein [Gammaproteobacteria bacterium]